MKKRFIITLLVSALILTGCGAKNEGAKEETKTEYFDFTVTEFVETLDDEYYTHLTYNDAVPLDDGTITNTYTHGSPGDSSAPMVHYRINYDEKTEKVLRITFTIHKDLDTDDHVLNLTHYFLHVAEVSSVIEPDIDSEALLDEIVEGFAENEININAALCDREKFNLFATNGDSYFDAMFTPKTT